VAEGAVADAHKIVPDQAGAVLTIIVNDLPVAAEGIVIVTADAEVKLNIVPLAKSIVYVEPESVTTVSVIPLNVTVPTQVILSDIVSLGVTSPREVTSAPV